MRVDGTDTPSPGGKSWQLGFNLTSIFEIREKAVVNAPAHEWRFKLGIRMRCRKIAPQKKHTPKAPLPTASATGSYAYMLMELVKKERGKTKYRKSASMNFKKQVRPKVPIHLFFLPLRFILAGWYLFVSGNQQRPKSRQEQKDIFTMASFSTDPIS